MKIAITAFTLFVGSACLFGAEQDLSGIFDPGTLKPVDSHLLVGVGELAPDFELPAIDGSPVRLSEYRGKHHVILTFVPAAWTPVCSAQWPGYNLMQEEFAELDALVIGVTVDNIPTLHAWVEAMGGIDFPVLSDFYPHGVVAQRYGILRSDGTTERALFVIDRQGIIRFIDVHDINVRPPLEELFEALEKIRTTESP